MLRRLLTPLAVATAAMVSLTTHAPPTPIPQPQLRTISFSVADSLGSVPTGFSQKGGGPVSPAGCHIVNVQNPHISSYIQQRQNVTSQAPG